MSRILWNCLCVSGARIWRHPQRGPVADEAPLNLSDHEISVENVHGHVAYCTYFWQFSTTVSISTNLINISTISKPKRCKKPHKLKTEWQCTRFISNCNKLRQRKWTLIILCVNKDVYINRMQVQLRKPTPSQTMPAS